MRTLVVGLGAVVLAACSAGSGGEGRQPQATAAAGAASAAVPASRFADYDPGAVAGGPGASKRYGFGRAPSSAELSRWDRDVGPDGAELPPGRGSVSQGEALYLRHCMACHNRNGEGVAPLYPAIIGRDGKAEGFHFASDPKLVKTIGNYWPNATTVFDYVRRAMPLTAPGSLTDAEVYSLTAYLLAANKVIAADAVLDAKALKAVKMPYGDKFVPDDRRGGPEVK